MFSFLKNIVSKWSWILIKWYVEKGWGGSLTDSTSEWVTDWLISMYWYECAQFLSSSFYLFIAWSVSVPVSVCSACLLTCVKSGIFLLFALYPLVIIDFVWLTARISVDFNSIFTFLKLYKNKGLFLLDSDFTTTCGIGFFGLRSLCYKLKLRLYLFIQRILHKMYAIFVVFFCQWIFSYYRF